MFRWLWSKINILKRRRYKIKTKDLNKDLLYELYIIKGLSTRDIAKELTLGQTTIRRYLEKFGIQTRDSKESRHTEGT